MMEWQSPLLYFTDSVLRAPTLGCMLMGIAAALVGVVVFLRRQSLLGEALSHACYPGVIVGILSAAALSPALEDGLWFSMAILTGAFVSALLGLWLIEWLRTRMRVHYDSALCFVLAGFFGVGITIASRVQFTHTPLYRKIQVYLYGQAATMRDFHIAIYALLALIIIFSIVVSYRQLQVTLLDREFAQTMGIRTRAVNGFFFLLIVLAVIVGIRCVGVVLMSAMLIAPAAAARQFTHRLWQVFLLAAFFGMTSGFLGNYLSVELSRQLSSETGGPLSIPTGPAVILVGTCICLLSLLLAPQRGLLVRYGRMFIFRRKCKQENLLKALWRLSQAQRITVSDLQRSFRMGALALRRMLKRLEAKGLLLCLEAGVYQLTDEGLRQGARIVRLHRLWERYLVDELGIGAERVHRSAEEIEHILTPDLERRLTELLDDPQQDPHQQPIPPHDVMTP